jgi:hypothetical protein
MNHLLLPVLGAAAAAAMCACSGYGVTATNSPPVSAFAAPPSDHATVCVFRPHGIGAAVVTPVTDNRRLVGATEGQSYFCYLAEPGEHTVQANDALETFDVAAGQHYYLRHRYSGSGDTLERVDQPMAQALAGHCVYTVLDETPEGRTAPPAIALARAKTLEPGPASTPVAKQPATATRQVAGKSP